MRFETVSLRNNLGKKKRLEVVSDIINRSSSDIILFGGHTVLDMADCNELVDGIENKETSVVFEVKKMEESSFVKLKNCLCRIENACLKNMFTNQLFSTSKEIESNIPLCERFVNELETKRIIEIKKKRCLVVQCGEINVVKNIQKEGNRPVFRLSNTRDLEKRFFDLLDSVDIIMNPIHTPMGNQGKMERRRELLSSNCRYYFSTSNTDERHSIDSSSLQYSFYNGNRFVETIREVSKDVQIRIFDID